MKTNELLKKLISFQTNQAKYDNGIKDFILKLFGNSDKEIFNIKNTKGRAFALKLKPRKSQKAKKTICFLCHLDTVNPSDGWKSDPYKALEKDGKIFGLGASDMKGPIVSLLQALLKKDYNREVVLMFTSDEETSVKDVINLQKILKIKDSLIIATEPAGRTINAGQKGILELKITTKGKSGHASTASTTKNKKESAIYKITEIIEFIKKQEQKLAKREDSKFGVSTVNFGKIEGGTAVNVIPDKCSLEISYRLVPKIKPEKILTELKQKIKKIDKETKIEILLLGKSFESKNELEIKKIRELLESSLKQKVELTYGRIWSEIAEFQEGNNVCLVIGPGEKNSCHCANEFVYVKQLDVFTVFFEKLLNDF